NPSDYLDEYDTIWIDANTEIMSPTFAREAIDALINGFALFAHPQRRDIYQEAEASLRLAPEKYRHQPIGAEVEHYMAEGFPRYSGLYACGTVARRRSLTVDLVGHEWYDECVRWSYQDQLSFPVVCRRNGVAPGVFRHRQIGYPRWFGNPW